MKRILIFAAIMALVSCRPDRTPQIAHYMIYGTTLSGEYTFNDSRSIDSLGKKVYIARPEELDYMVLEPERCNDVLYHSRACRPPKLAQRASEKEAFAFNLIEDREAQLSKEFYEYVSSLGRKNDRTAFAGVVSAYIQGLPSVIADKTLFGQPAGTDLIDWCLFEKCQIIDIFGMDFMMEKKADETGRFLTASEYFLKEKMMPMGLRICFKEVPEEVDINKRPIISNKDTLIIVTIKIPVTFECYWDWCKALYSNPKAEERIYDGYITATMYLSSK